MNDLLISGLVIAFILISAICSGLNIALMALDVSDLRRKARNGNRQASIVLPFRRNSHLSLAAILLTNVAMVSATSLVLENRFNGLIAGLLTTVLIVIFGEIVPQALFVRRALPFVAAFAPLLRFMIIVTFPVSRPIQFMLDKLFGREKARLHSRDELGIILNEHVGHNKSELDEDEVEIMRGALALSNKRVRDIVTPLHHVFWLRKSDIIDATQIDQIKAASWSRIPIFNNDLTDCEGILLMKDLVDLDFDDEPRPVGSLPLHPTRVVGSMTALDTMFRRFIAAKTHLIPVERDDKIIGIITIEDLLEEILGHEIEDESDRSRAANAL